MTASLTLEGRHALVTGASSGLGQHFAGFLSDAGAKVTLAARREAALTRNVEELRARGGEAQSVPMDVTDSGSIASALERAESGFGPITVLINNAGVTATGPALDLDEAAWDKVIDTNLKGVWLAAQAGARRMVRHGTGGSIVNIASILGLRVTAGVLSYTVSKAGVVQMTKVLALEWARHRIRVNALAPGYIETDINRDFFATEAGKALIKRIPQRRLGAVRELEAPLLLLASDASLYMTGSVIAVDGGHLVSGL
jgi:NAD(P)-dependent dehydrogenase (short-subunit alcohol dehydrogenase family)